MPYQFEPRCEEDRQVSRANEGENVELDLRLNNVDWCKCSHCVILGSERECRCCHEIDTIFEKVDSFNADHAEDGMIRCITEHPGFSSVCLDPYVLETAYYQYRQQYGVVDVPELNERHRYVAYRQLARWCWGYLGKEVRVVLPACAVTRIRVVYPSDVYRGFEDV